MDAPKLLADQGACQDRRAALAQPHVAPLASFVDRLRRQQRGSRVPDFDPWDGGVQAECLFLLEAPGPKSVASGFVSRNNPDETAKNFFELNHEAGLSRSRTITWNVVPWYVGDESRIRPVTAADIDASAPYLAELLRLLPRLRAVVLLGRKAQRIRRVLEAMPKRLELFDCPHPSPLSVNGRPERRREIRRCLDKVSLFLGTPVKTVAKPSIERTVTGRPASAAHVKRLGVTMSVLCDVLAPGLAVVFCGTAVGAASARRRAYYAGPGNAFWSTLFDVGLTPCRLEPEKYRSIKGYGLGLTDLAKTISGSDRILSAEHFDRIGLRAKIRRYRPRLLAFTSKRAAEEFVGHPVDYGLLDERIGTTMLFVLPSPSGAARRYWDKKPWRELARLRSAAEPAVAPDPPRRASPAYAGR